MKTRAGFVSNSSSSSFIVSFPEDPANISNLQEMMMGCGQEDYTYGAMTEEEVINRVFNDVVQSGPATEKDIREEMAGDVYWEVSKHIDSDEYRNADGRIDWQRYNAAREVIEAKILEPKVKNFMRENRNKYVYVFEYHDDSGEACLEHGNIFANVPYIRISNH